MIYALNVFFCGTYPTSEPGVIESRTIRNRNIFYFICIYPPPTCRIDANKSTKGASKLRRDLINAEIANLRDLLPLPQSTRQRLSQLQLMALVCVYVRKANYFQQGSYLYAMFPRNDWTTLPAPFPRNRLCPDCLSVCLSLSPPPLDGFLAPVNVDKLQPAST